MRDSSTLATGFSLPACAQIEGPITSTYVWDEEVKDSEEYRLTLKTTNEKAQAAEDYIADVHSYDTPEIIQFEVKTTSAYEEWVIAETT